MSEPGPPGPAPGQPAHSVTVTGSGTAEAVPDVLTGAAAMPVEPGTTTVTVTIEVEWAFLD